MKNRLVRTKFRGERMTEEQKRLESVLLRLVGELYRKGTTEQVSLISHELIELWEVARKDGIS